MNLRGDVMDALDEKMIEYADKFGENFPTFYYRYESQAWIMAKIDECIKKGKPMKVPEENDAIDI